MTQIPSLPPWLESSVKYSSETFINISHSDLDFLVSLDSKEVSHDNAKNKKTV